MERPFVTMNMAMTADGKITSARREEPRFASRRDKARMDRYRAEADAILVGAGTLRADDPPLHVRDPEMKAYRKSLGKPRGIHGYYLWMSTNGGSYTQLNASPVLAWAGVKWVQTGLQSSSTYCFKVASADLAGNVSSQTTEICGSPNP